MLLSSKCQTKSIKMYQKLSLRHNEANFEHKELKLTNGKAPKKFGSSLKKIVKKVFKAIFLSFSLTLGEGLSLS